MKKFIEESFRIWDNIVHEGIEKVLTTIRKVPPEEVLAAHKVYKTRLSNIKNEILKRIKEYKILEKKIADVRDRLWKLSMTDVNGHWQWTSSGRTIKHPIPGYDQLYDMRSKLQDDLHKIEREISQLRYSKKTAYMDFLKAKGKKLNTIFKPDISKDYW